MPKTGRAPRRELSGLSVNVCIFHWTPLHPAPIQWNALVPQFCALSAHPPAEGAHSKIHMTAARLTSVDWLIMILYFVFVLGIGFALKRYMKTSKDFFQAGRALPAWICGLAFISANLGAQEVIGMGASGAKYGLETATSTASAPSPP